MRTKTAKQGAAIPRIDFSIKGFTDTGVDVLLQIRADSPAELRALTSELQPEIERIKASRPKDAANKITLICPECGDEVWDNRKQTPPKNKPSFKCKRCGWKQEPATPEPPAKARTQ